MDDLVPIRRALLSVTDKTGLVELAQALAAAGAEIVSTGGSAAVLRAAGITVRDVAELSGFPEILDGRVKTLVPQVHGGILARRDEASHRAALDAHGIGAIDLVAVNLYAFESVAASGADEASCLEAIDIGGPALLRAAAKNHAHVTVLSDPVQYPAVIEAVRREGGTRLAARRALAGAAHARTAAYDAAIAAWYAGGEALPDPLVLVARRRQRLRYGENPQQEAALYAWADAAPPDLACARLVQGKPLSFNNLADAQAAIDLAREFPGAAVVIVKHGTPCGVARGEGPEAAWRRALAADPVSAFGGVVACSVALDEAAARAIGEIFTEVVIAPAATGAAIAALGARPGLRLLLTGEGGGGHARPRLRSVGGGLLAQTEDREMSDPATWRVVTQRTPNDAERADLAFAERVAKHALSNAIVLAREEATIGIGSGQTNRVDATRQAASRARALGHAPERGCVVASDAFFPFPDGLLEAAAAGATAAIQPGGSVRDAAVIEAADQAGMAMVFTGVRHFRH